MDIEDNLRTQLVGCIVEGGIYSAQDALECYLRSVSDKGYKLPDIEVGELFAAVELLPNGSALSETEAATRRMVTLLRLGDLAVSADELLEDERERLFESALGSFNGQFRANIVHPNAIDLYETTRRWEEKSKISGNEWLVRALEQCIENDPKVENLKRKSITEIPKEIMRGLGVVGAFAFRSLLDRG
jgi:hypothetical protein